MTKSERTALTAIRNNKLSFDGQGCIMSKLGHAPRQAVALMSNVHENAAAYAELFVAAPGLLSSLEDLLLLCEQSEYLGDGYAYERARKRVTDLTKSLAEYD